MSGDELKLRRLSVAMAMMPIAIQAIGIEHGHDKSGNAFLECELAAAAQFAVNAADALMIETGLIERPS